MTTRLTAITIAGLVCLIIWGIVVQMVAADSRQRCEAIHSVDTCAWELR